MSHTLHNLRQPIGGMVALIILTVVAESAGVPALPVNPLPAMASAGQRGEQIGLDAFQVESGVTPAIATASPVPIATPTRVPTATPTSTAVPGQVTLLFSDEFDGTSLDASKWNTCHWWDDGGCTIAGNGELEWYQPDDVLVSDGTLKLRAQKRTVKANNGKTYKYTSGMVTTGRNTYDLSIPPPFAFQYGYAEIRAKIPKGQGLWSAFWMLPAANHAFPEIDVMEIIGRQFEKNHMVIHYLGDDGKRRRSARSFDGPDWSADWHRFGVDWQPTALTWYIDGVPRYRYTTEEQIPAESMVLVANLAVGGSWPGPPDATTVFPSYLEVDYVKVWSEMPEEAKATEPLVTTTPVTATTTESVPQLDSASPTVQPAFTAMPGPTPTPTAVPGQVSLLFSDEFAGASLDAGKWTTCYWWRDSAGGCTIEANEELQLYQPDDVLVGDGVLKLRAQERTAITSAGKTYAYTSGMISTGREFLDDPQPDRFAFRYGYVEIRTKMPKGKGLWPSFWLLAADQEWPPEIDIASFRGDRIDTVRFGVQYIAADASDAVSSREWRGPNFAGDWHTFAVDWQEASITWYVDGVKRWGITDPEPVPNEPMYLVIDLAVGGHWPGNPDVSTEFPSYLELDWVKVWSEKPN